LDNQGVTISLLAKVFQNLPNLNHIQVGIEEELFDPANDYIDHWRDRFKRPDIQCQAWGMTELQRKLKGTDIRLGYKFPADLLEALYSMQDRDWTVGLAFTQEHMSPRSSKEHMSPRSLEHILFEAEYRLGPFDLSSQKWLNIRDRVRSICCRNSFTNDELIDWFSRILHQCKNLESLALNHQNQSLGDGALGVSEMTAWSGLKRLELSDSFVFDKELRGCLSKHADTLEKIVFNKITIIPQNNHYPKLRFRRLFFRWRSALDFGPGKYAEDAPT
jgi:hypothetical protein